MSDDDNQRPGDAFMLGRIHQMVEDVRTRIENLVTRAEFDNVAQLMRDHVASDKDIHKTLDARLDAIDRSRERLIGIMIGVGLVSGGTAAAIVAAVSKAIGGP